MSEKPPDLILLDIIMPGMDGYEVCRRLKADKKTSNISIIFISTQSEEKDETKALGFGGVDYIRKPFSPAIVEARIRTHLQLKKHRDHLVDDEKGAIDAIQPMLEKLGYEIIARTSSIEALEAFRHHSEAFDLVITDMTMPNMTGKDLAKELMVVRPDIPIILCTGFSENIDERRAELLSMVNRWATNKGDQGPKIGHSQQNNNLMDPCLCALWCG